MKKRQVEKLRHAGEQDTKGTDTEEIELERKLRNASIQLLPGYMDSDGFCFALLRRK